MITREGTLAATRAVDQPEQGSEHDPDGKDTQESGQVDEQSACEVGAKPRIEPTERSTLRVMITMASPIATTTRIDGVSSKSPKPIELNKGRILDRGNRDYEE